jgi:hypothetical protein
VDRPRAAKLMIWKSEGVVWCLTLWIPFHGQWLLAKHVKRPMFDRKVNQIIRSLGLPVEEVDKVPN